MVLTHVHQWHTFFIIFILVLLGTRPVPPQNKIFQQLNAIGATKMHLQPFTTEEISFIYSIFYFLFYIYIYEKIHLLIVYSCYN